MYMVVTLRRLWVVDVTLCGIDISASVHAWCTRFVPQRISMGIVKAWDKHLKICASFLSSSLSNLWMSLLSSRVFCFFYCLYFILFCGVWLLMRNYYVVTIKIWLNFYFVRKLKISVGDARPLVLRYEWIEELSFHHVRCPPISTLKR